MSTLSLPLAAQNCYVRLDDASGYTPTAGQLAELEAAACRLIDSLPSAFRDSFRVYDFGFYLHNETRQGGYPEAFQWAVDTVQTLSKYYLLFGKQTDRSGVCTRFWVDLKLPETGEFSCIDLISPHFRAHILEKFRLLTNAEYNKRSNQYFWYAATEDVNNYMQYYLCVHPDRSAKATGIYFPENCMDIQTKIQEARNDTFDLMILYGVLEPGSPQSADKVFCMVLEKEPGIPPNGGGKLYIFNEYGEFVKEAIGCNYHGIFFSDVSVISCWETYKQNLFLNINQEGPVNPATPDELAQFAEFYLSDQNIAYLKSYHNKTVNEGREFGGLASVSSKKLVFDECNWCTPNFQYPRLKGREVFDFQKYPNYNAKEFVFWWHSHPADIDAEIPSSAWYLSDPGDFEALHEIVSCMQASFMECSLADNIWKLGGRFGIIASNKGITIFRIKGNVYKKVNPHFESGGCLGTNLHPSGYCYKKIAYIGGPDSLKYQWISYDLHKSGGNY